MVRIRRRRLLIFSVPDVLLRMCGSTSSDYTIRLPTHYGNAVSWLPTTSLEGRLTRLKYILSLTDHAELKYIADTIHISSPDSCVIWSLRRRRKPSSRR